MATTYFPNPMSALPEPRFTPPQQDFAPVLGAALQTLTGVANNWRQKQMSVQAAEKMAGALEAEGLTQEAGMYRQAAQAYDINFFSTPEQNEQFNRTLLTDSLKLLQNKQEMELKRSAQEIQNDYYRSLTEGRNEASSDRQAALADRSADRAATLAETKRRNDAYVIGSRMDDIRAEAKNLQDEIFRLQTGAEKGVVDPNSQAIKSRIIDIQRRQQVLDQEYNQHNARLRQVMSTDATGSAPDEVVSQAARFYSPGNPLFGIVPKPVLDANQQQGQIDALGQNPTLGRVGDVSRRNLGTTSTTVGPNGTSTTTSSPNEGIKGVPADPTAPKHFSPNKF